MRNVERTWRTPRSRRASSHVSRTWSSTAKDGDATPARRALPTTDGGTVIDAGSRPGTRLSRRRSCRRSRAAVLPSRCRQTRSVAAVVNRDVGSLSVLKVKYEEGKITTTEQQLRGSARRGLGALAGRHRRPTDDTAFVVLRKDQKLARIKQPRRASPWLDGMVEVGSEPTSLALSPSGRTAYVTNWANGDVSVIDTARFEVTGTIDLNAAAGEDRLPRRRRRRVRRSRTRARSRSPTTATATTPTSRCSSPSTSRSRSPGCRPTA